VDFDDIAGRVAMMAGEVSAAETRVTPTVTGRFGPLPSAVATPLALVLTELLQNALQHGLAQWSGTSTGGSIEIAVTRTATSLTVTVADNGVGLPDGFDLDATTSLGLHIVRTLVVSELGGRLEVSPRPGGGTSVLVDVPLHVPAPVLPSRPPPDGTPSSDGRGAG
jgi:hypothetical protein